MHVTNVVQSLGYQPQFQQYQQQPRQQAQKTQIHPISMSYVDLFPRLLLHQGTASNANKIDISVQARPFCAFHQGAPGHDIEHCFAFQKLVQKNLIPFEEFEFEYAG